MNHLRTQPEGCPRTCLEVLAGCGRRNRMSGAAKQRLLSAIAAIDRILRPDTRCQACNGWGTVVIGSADGGSASECYECGGTGQAE